MVPTQLTEDKELGLLYFSFPGHESSNRCTRRQQSEFGQFGNSVRKNSGGGKNQN